ncbi:gluconate kinase [Trichocoleus sp. FACHB-591]|nr:gluconate kinase [Trichocoleus sp. FACHB-591]
MGAAGSGKTVVGRLLSERLECDFLEGDRRHPQTNILKMLSHQPLHDADRRQWLLEIEDDIQRAGDRNRETVITCSALKLSYRKQLAALGRVQLVYLEVPHIELERRLTQRQNHYMQSVMLQGQIAAFDLISPEENVITVDGLLPPIEAVNSLLSQAMQRFPSLKQPWWQRSAE